MTTKVIVCGAFDPYPHAGHLNHFREAKKLGNYLVVILNTDTDVIRKRGVVFTPMGQRYMMLQDNKYVDEIVISIDGDGTVARTLLMVRPDIFAKGGDRESSNMPQSEIDACKKIGCEIIYGVGAQLDSSTEILKRIQKYQGEITHKVTGIDFT